jgi:riboflavin transporter FmnP
MSNSNYSRKKTLQFIARTAIFGSIAAILYAVPLFQFKLPGFPPFLEIHFDEIPVLIASFAYGPWCGLATLVLKTIIKLPFTSSLCVGELADLIYGAALILPASFIYKYMKNKFVAFPLGLTIGVICQLVISLIFNIYVMIPFYAFVMGYTMEAILQMCNALNPLITDTQWTLGFYAILPFNAIKDAIIVPISILIYLPLKELIKRINRQDNGNVNN